MFVRCFLNLSCSFVLRYVCVWFRLITVSGFGCSVLVAFWFCLTLNITVMYRRGFGGWSLFPPVSLRCLPLVALDVLGRYLLSRYIRWRLCFLGFGFQSGFERSVFAFTRFWYSPDVWFWVSFRFELLFVRLSFAFVFILLL